LSKLRRFIRLSRLTGGEEITTRYHVHACLSPLLRGHTGGAPG
jgi:hypothetical protein